MFLLHRPVGQPLHVALYNEIKQQIQTGSRAPNSRLPSIRQLSIELAISRTTIEQAYDQLRTEGFVHSLPQRGYYVSALDPEFIAAPLPAPSAAALPEPAVVERFTDFHPATLDPHSFPIKIWRKLLCDALAESADGLSRYGQPQGEPELRLEIQRYLARFRGVACQSEQIIICAGLQDSLRIAAKLLREEHGALAVEDPGHWLPQTVFADAAFAVHALPVTPSGIDLDRLRQSACSIVYVTPSHQFPLGCVMPIENRLKLLKWAEETGGVIIEDDYDSELRYQGRPIPALQGLQPDGNILYLGTFSKVLSPALRISYLVLPQRYLADYQRLFQRFAPTVSYLDQKILASFMQQGFWERHLRKMRTICKRKQAALVDAVSRHFGRHVCIHGQGAGLHLVLEFVGHPFTEDEIITKARQQGLRLLPLGALYQNGDNRNKLLLGFGCLTPDEIERGVATLAQLLREVNAFHPA